MTRHIHILLPIVVLLTSTACGQKDSLPKASGESLRHFYVNGTPSVVITPWTDGRRTLILFNLYGDTAFTFEEIKAQLRAELIFAGNGAVKTMVLNTQEGNKSDPPRVKITFDGTNGPVVRTEEDPEGGDRRKSVSFWDKKTREWRAQEVISCMPVPEK